MKRSLAHTAHGSQAPTQTRASASAAAHNIKTASDRGARTPGATGTRWAVSSAGDAQPHRTRHVPSVLGVLP